MPGVQLSDVPDKYDVVFQLNDGSTYGFLLADSVESNLPFRTHKALYSYSPTFLERQNLSDAYGDNFQDFFLTGAQADFSLGEQQKFFRVNDANRNRRYFNGLNIDPTTVPGNVTLTRQTTTINQSGIQYVCANSTVASSGYAWMMADGTNLYGVSTAGAVTNIGAHGAGSNVNSMCVDESNVYIAGTTNLIKWNGSAFSTFNANAYGQVAFINNILYAAHTTLYSFDTSGNRTAQFTWQNADGTNPLNNVRKMVPFGGQLYILRNGRTTGELWNYDGSGVKKLADFPPDVFLTDMCVSQGIVFVSGNLRLINASKYFPQVYYYASGSIGKLWDSGTNSASTSQTVGVDAFGNGIVFADPTTGNILQYDTSYGGVHTIANSTNYLKVVAANTTSAWLGWSGGTTLTAYGISASYNSTGNIQTSQYDFDNTLNKSIRAIKVDADIPANTSVDLAYQLDGCGGTYTTLQTGINSGQEYLLPASTAAHSISLKVTLNSATGSATPTVKRVYVRAAPLLNQFRRREYLLDLSGGLREELGKTSRRNRDGTVYPFDPLTACNNLKKVALQTIPFTVVDRFAQNPGFTCIADLQQNLEGYDGFAIYEIRPNVFIGRINVREV